MSAPCLSQRKGISWVEMLAVVTILAIIAAIIVPRVAVSSDTAKVRINHHNKAMIDAAVDRWYVEKGSWPADDLSDASADARYFPNGVPTNPFDDSAYRLNPATHHVD